MCPGLTEMKEKGLFIFEQILSFDTHTFLIISMQPPNGVILSLSDLYCNTHFLKKCLFVLPTTFSIAPNN